MKKILLTLSTVLLTAQISFGAIGYVDYSYIYKNLPISQDYKRRMDIKAQQIRSYNLETNKLIKAQKTNEEKTKINDSRKQQLHTLERDYINLSAKRDAVVQEKVKTASNIVMTNKKLEAILDSRFVITGAVNCTQDVFKAIK